MPLDDLRLYSLAESAERLRVTEDWLLKRLRGRQISGHKSGRTWTMSAGDIRAAIEFMAIPAIVPKPDPHGLSPRSRRYLQRRGGAR